ncbi:Receptor kinase-like protein Xa21 [Linum perenne]
MQRNILTGQIPSSIGNLTKLNLLDISNNRLQRAIPLSLGNCQQLNQLDVSANKLTGEIPGLLYYFKVRSSKKQTSVADSALTHYMMVSYKDLHQATNGFSSDNLIGSGGFGTIYKGVLDQVANPVAVKVLNIHEKKAYKCLLAECNALKCARHRNLVRILT